MALRFHLLKLVHRQANKISNLADGWASQLQPADHALVHMQESTLVVVAPETLGMEDGQIIPLTNKDGALQAGLLTYGLEESRSIIDHIRQEELYGTGSSEGGAISSQVGDAVAGLSPAILTGLKMGQLYQVIGPPSVVHGLAQGTMKMVQSQTGGALGVVTQQGASQFVGQARFAQMSATSVVAPLMVYQAIHMIVGTQQINEINRRLASIERTLERIVQRQNAKDLGEVIAATTTLRDILQEHQHSGRFNGQMRDRLSHCERDLRAHLERLRLLKSQFHSKLEAAKAKSKSRDRAVQLATLIKEEGEQFGQDTRLLIALCGAVMQLEQGLMAIALEHHPESLPYRKKQMQMQMDECRETLSDMINLAEVQDEIRICLEEMNWWQKNMFDRSATSTLKEASSIPMDSPAHPSTALGGGASGSMLVWIDPQKGVQVRAIAEDSSNIDTLPTILKPSTSSGMSSHAKGQAPKDQQHALEAKHLALCPSHSLRVGEIYRLPITDLDMEVPIRILDKTGYGQWIGVRTDLPDVEYVEIMVDDE